MAATPKTLEERVVEFKELGYTQFSGLFSAIQMARWKEKFESLQNEMVPGGKPMSWWYGDMVERAPTLMLPAVAEPAILDFAERVMGPFVQLDNLTLAGFPSVPAQSVVGRVAGWHRDRWAQLPQEGVYVRPHAINAIAYLQDLTPAFGPLRVIPGSHRRAVSLTTEAAGLPHADEVVLEVKAGDVVVVHNCLLHSGTPNTSGQTRYFFSVFYNLTWLRTTDNHHGPNVQALLARARAENDLRTQRLFGHDSQIEARANCGFQRPDEECWAQWAEADRAIMNAES